MNSNKIESKQIEEVIYNLLIDRTSHDELLRASVLGRRGDAILRKLNSFQDRELSDSGKALNWAGNLITLAGVYLYTKFNLWRNQNNKQKELPNSLYLERLLAGLEEANEFARPSAELRVLRVLDSLYSVYDMSLMLVKYIIVNSQIEAGMCDKGKRGLSETIGFPHESSFELNYGSNGEKDGYNLVEAFNYISAARNTPSNIENFDADIFPYEEVNRILCDVLSALEFMKRIKLKINEDGSVDFIEQLKDGDELRIPTHGILKAFMKSDSLDALEVYTTNTDEPPIFLVLESIDYQHKNSCCNLIYRSFDESQSVSMCVFDRINDVHDTTDHLSHKIASAVDYYKRVTGYLPETRQKSFFFSGMVTAHYRYHNVFAPAVADAIDDEKEAKVQLLQKFIRKDRLTFEEVFKPVFRTLERLDCDFSEIYADDSETKKWEKKIDIVCRELKTYGEGRQRFINWDAIIARILMYDGPSELMKCICVRDQKIADVDTINFVFNEIIKGIGKRFIESVFNEENKTFAKTVSSRQNRIYKSLYKNIEHQKGNIPRELFHELDCKIRIDSYIESIVKTLTNSDSEYSEEEHHQFENRICDKLSIFEKLNAESINDKNIAEKTLVSTINAFLAFYSGVHSCSHKRIMYEFEKGSRILSAGESNKHKNEIESEFKSGVSSEIKRLTKLCTDESHTKKPIEVILCELISFANKSSDAIKNLHRSSNAIFKRNPIDKTGLHQIISTDENNEIKFKTPDGKNLLLKQVNERNRGSIRAYITALKNVLLLLSGKSGDDDYDYSYKDLVKKVVYPQVVTYAKHVDGDGNDFLIMDHSGAFKDFHDGKVHILTEFVYKMNQAYYALPNIHRAEKEWWIDPFLISCYEFDKEVRDAMQGVAKEL